MLADEIDLMCPQLWHKISVFNKTATIAKNLLIIITTNSHNFTNFL